MAGVSNLIEELVKAGFLSEAAARKTIEEASLAGGDPEELLYERRLVGEAEAAKIKSRLLGVPYKSFRASEIASDILKVIPEETVRNYRIVPLSQTKELLTVGMFNPADERAREVLKFLAKQLRVNLGVYLITLSEWQEVLRRYSSYQNEVEMAVKSLNVEGRTAAASQKIVQLEEGISASEEAPIIKLVAASLKEAVYEKASDIHIEPGRNSLRIRFRLDGDLKTVSVLPAELHQPIVSRVKVLSNLKLDEGRIPQDGRFRTVLLGRDIDFRVSTFPTTMGEKAAIRVLDPSVGLKGLKGLGLQERNLNIIKEGITRPYGMVLITGPTGSGKTTTLYSLLQLLNKEDVNIVSLEDPVEYFIEGLNQSQVRPEIGYDFASGLREILRQDPDVIMVGEIRDEETAGLAVHAALTGHVVLSTLHTNNSLGVIPRLIDMKVDAFLLPSSLNLMVAQRLISRLCDKCKKEEKAPLEIQSIIKKNIDNLPEDLSRKWRVEADQYKIYHAPGCEACHGKGISGRIALFEVLAMTPELENIVLAGPSERKLLEEARRQGMVSLRQDGILKVLEGLVSVEEVLRETTEVW